jgi:uncharacterized protein YggE
MRTSGWCSSAALRGSTTRWNGFGALVGDEGEVTTAELRVHRHYDEFEEDEGPARRMHAASGPIAVECTPALAVRVLSEAMALGVDEVEGIRYAVRDPSPQLEDLLVEAVDAARRKAEGLAQAAERPLGGIVAVEEQSRSAWGNDVRAIELVGAAATGSSNCSCTRPSCRWQHRSA